MAAGKAVGSMDDDENPASVAEDSSPAESYTLEALKLIKEAQQQHGLRHGDYQRYRQYCARRLRRIRKSLHFPQGTRNKVQPKKITEDNISDVRFLYIPLVEAERAWAYAMQLKSEANTEHRKGFHMMGRMKKAVSHAEVFSSLCEGEKCDARTKLEAQAYVAWMKGMLHFELENWKKAIEDFNKAKKVYENLALAVTDDSRELYQQKAEELSPNIRYCAYNIGDESAIGDLREMRLKTGTEDPMTSRLDELIQQTREKQAATLSEVTWRGRTVPVKNETVRLCLLSVQESEQELAQAESHDSKISIYESLLKQLIDAQQSLREEYKEDPAFKAAQRGQMLDDRVPNSVYLDTHLKYLRLTKTVERNQVMVETYKSNMVGEGGGEEGKKVTKPQDLARLYDIIIQNMSEIPRLQGLEEDEKLQEEIESKIQFFKAFRCFYIAQTYAFAKKWQEASALYEKVLQYSDEAKDALKASRKGHQQNSKKEIVQLQALEKEVDGLKYSCRAASILDMGDLTEQMSTLTVKNKKPLSDRLTEYYEDPTLSEKKPNLVSFPPDFTPIPCKPIFFDLALNHVEFPSLEDRMEQKKAAGGITGLVKGWFWGAKK